MAEVDDQPANELSYEEKVARASIISKPMAPKKMAKKLFKLIKKGNETFINIEKCLTEVYLYVGGHDKIISR